MEQLFSKNDQHEVYNQNRVYFSGILIFDTFDADEFSIESRLKSVSKRYAVFLANMREPDPREFI